MFDCTLTPDRYGLPSPGVAALYRGHIELTWLHRALGRFVADGGR